MAAKLKKEFDARNCKVIAMSTGSVLRSVKQLICSGHISFRTLTLSI